MMASNLCALHAPAACSLPPDYHAPLLPAQAHFYRRHLEVGKRRTFFLFFFDLLSYKPCEKLLRGTVPEPCCEAAKTATERRDCVFVLDFGFQNRNHIVKLAFGLGYFHICTITPWSKNSTLKYSNPCPGRDHGKEFQREKGGGYKNSRNRNR